MTEAERAMLTLAMDRVMMNVSDALKIIEESGRNRVDTAPRAYAALRTMARRAGDIKRMAIHGLDDI